MSLPHFSQTVLLRLSLIAFGLLGLSGCVVETRPMVIRERPVYVPRPMYAPRPVYAQRPVYINRPVYSPRPAYGRPPVYVEPPLSSGSFVSVLPPGAEVVLLGRERCWRYRGQYYRRHAHGFVLFLP